MATLNSPGVSVTIIDQSQYASTQAGSIPFVLLATASNKMTPSNTLATGTTIANAEKIITVTSQRDLVNYFGAPNFTLDAAGNPVNDDEQNEYGLLAAYSALGITNQMYVQRANVDLGQLTGTSVRPTGTPSDGTYWLDLTNTNWGIYEWTAEDGFTLTSPTVITSTSYLSGGVPLSSFGAIGDYAVVSTSSSNPIYYKGWNNSWALVGSDSWKDVVATVTGANANPTLSVGWKMVINGTNVTLTGTTVSSVATNINAASIRGVSASASSTGQLLIYADSLAASSGNISLADGKLSIKSGTYIGATDAAGPLGLLQSQATITANAYVYNGPTVSFSGYTNPPAWRTSDVTPRPNGSVWFKTTATGNGANWSIKEYSSTLASWQQLAAPLYDIDSDAIYGLDPTGGGAGIAVGTTYVK
jgi:hypothetical protein